MDSKRLCTVVSTKKKYNNAQLSDETMWLKVLFTLMFTLMFTLIFTFSHCRAASGED